MNQYERIIAALTIFNKYDHSKELYAEHDEIYAGPLSSDVTEEDIAILKTLDWYPHEDGFMSFV